MITISIQDNATPQVAALIARLEDRTGLHQAIGNQVAARIRDHVLGMVPGSHNTAGRLGATPSNFVGKAAQSIEAPVANQAGVTIRLNHPWFARAFGDVTIRPTSGLYLTLPLVAQAYNQRAYRIQGLFVWTNPKTRKKFLAESIRTAGVKAALKLWYLLVPQVVQPQERGRLPSDESLTQSALLGARDYFSALRQAQGSAPAKN